jgi:hypothetical protein
MSHVRRCRCGTALARDNAGALCSACHQAQRRGRAPEVPAEFWRTALIGTALASGDLGRVIRMYSPVSPPAAAAVGRRGLAARQPGDPEPDRARPASPDDRRDRQLHARTRDAAGATLGRSARSGRRRGSPEPSEPFRRGRRGRTRPQRHDRTCSSCVDTSDAPDLCRLDVTPAWVMGDDARCWLRLQPRKAIPMFGEGPASPAARTHP